MLQLAVGEESDLGDTLEAQLIRPNDGLCTGVYER